MKKLAAGILGAILLFFLVAPMKFIEFLLTVLTYHPWRTCMALVILLALFIWLLRAEYQDEPEESAQV